MTKYIQWSTGYSLLDEAIENYLIHGFAPGGLLTAVLSNNLFLAIGRADHWNRERLDEIVQQISQHMPSNSYGDPQTVQDWLDNKDNRRTNYAYAQEQALVMRILRGEQRQKSPEDVPF